MENWERGRTCELELDVVEELRLEGRLGRGDEVVEVLRELVEPGYGDGTGGHLGDDVVRHM